MTRVNKITIYLDDKELAAIDGEREASVWGETRAQWVRRCAVGEAQRRLIWRKNESRWEDMTPDRFGGELIAFSDDNGRTCSLSRIRLFQLLPSLLSFVLGKQGEEIWWR